MGLRTLLLLCIAVSLRSADCAKESEDSERARLPELLTELDLASLEASEEDIDALKKVVKRLAPAKNVFFGNEELLKEWLSGAGLGQPGVDFPMLTTIPTTAFSCRGLKGGYYADLETNCQVFHICDNGRKISFLCPNGTIFQQSQLICDWWFKVDCSKSTELYEQSAEQLAQEERKRADLKRVNSEFHRSDNNYQNSNYDGKQNGRTNPYGTSKNQLDQRPADAKSSRTFDPSQIYNQNSRSGNQFSQINDLASNSGFTPSHESKGKNQESYAPQSRTSNYQNIERQQNQLIEDRSGKQFQDQRGSSKYSSLDNYYTTVGSRDNSRTPKSRSPHDDEGITSRGTPAYTETTTFRTSTPTPIKEYQQPAESAAFASSRGNRYNKPYNSNQYNSYYNPATNAPPRRPTLPPITSKPRQETPQGILKPKVKIPDYPYPTFTPIYRPRTTTYDSTTQTTSPPQTNTYYNRDRTTNWETTTNLYTTGQDYRTTTETIYPEDTTNTYRGSRVTSTAYTATTSTPPTTYINSETYDNSVDTRDYARTAYTTRASPSITQRYSTGSPSSGFPATAITKSAINGVTVDQNSLSTHTQDDKLGRTKTSWKSTSRTSQNYRQNAISPSTEKPRITQVSPQSQTSKTSPPYDTSITYQNGKVMSTLGPYVPFTKNYAYTTSTATTQRPAVYTATVPTYSTPQPQYRSSAKAGRIQYPASVNRVRGSSTYLPDANSTVKRPSDSKSLIEREHAFNMLESLRGLEGTMPTIIGNTSRSGLTIPHSSSPATLHSLALYFATASDEFGGSDQGKTEESAEKLQTPLQINKTAKIDLPTTILTEHTINSYAELFNLNNALETSSNSTESEQQSGEVDSNDDLDLQQSEGPVTGSKKSNSTKLRELAQVFTHALSAYLQDPATFKKILAEIRPTAPPGLDNEDGFTTTSIPTTSEDYPSVTKEKDEVLDFSEDVTAPRRPILQTTTEIPTTTDDAGFGYYTTSVTSESQSSSTLPPPGDQNYLNPTNDFASAVNHAFDSSNGIQSLSGPSAPSGPTSNDALNDYENYFPDTHRLGDSHRNSTYEPYGKYVKPVNSVPIGDNYVSSSTPATYQQTLPPENPGGNVITSNKNYRTTGENSGEQTESPDVTTTVEPFRIRYYDTTTIRSDDSDESLVTANSIYSSYNNYNRLNNAGSDDSRDDTEISEISDHKEDDEKSHNNHWTSSPTVTQLWESTVFVDPKRINQGLTSEGVSQTSSVEAFGNDPTTTTHSSVPVTSELLVTDASGGVTSRNSNRGSDPTTPWQWGNTDTDSPTAFSLLPTAYSTEHTATPAPIYTTRSSITTTITSSVISTSSLPQASLFPVKARFKNTIGNATENEIVRAKQMFGGLNDTSTDALMRVMKTADHNATVRQLVLLLISHCTGPMNKTREEEKEQLLNALLSMPVNQFTSEESKELVAGLNRLNIPDDLETRSTTRIVTSTEPVATTFRSKKSRRIKSNGDESTVEGRGRDSRGTEEETSVSDGRALELLRSLYTVAAKWG